MRLILAAATLSATAAVCSAQAVNQPGPATSNEMQTQAAPIERAYPHRNGYPDVKTTEPAAGVMVRAAEQSSVQTVSSDAQKLELRVERGVVNVNVHDPDKNFLLLVDLPGGQTQLLKNGLYTFNADTNTARVLRGEALAFPAGAKDSKPIKVKEYNRIVFSGKNVRAHDFAPYEARMDLLPMSGPRKGEGPGGGGGWPGYGYGYGPYGDGFYGGGYPYYGYGYPWAWGYPYYPYGYGFYPFVGFGFGYYGGWGYRGGFRGGFRR